MTHEETRICFYCGFTGSVSEFLCFEAGEGHNDYGRCRSCSEVSGSLWEAKPPC